LLPSNVAKLISPLVEGIPNSPSYRVGEVKTNGTFGEAVPELSLIKLRI